MFKHYVTIKRPNGDIEELDYTEVVRQRGGILDAHLFGKIKKAMSGAGKGTCTGYRTEDTRPAKEQEAEAALRQIETLRDKAEDVKDANYDLYLRRMKDADAAFCVWKTDYPEAYAKIVAREEVEAARRREQYETSFVARNLD